MKDRIPVNPGRVLINPEDGSAPFYATMTRADSPTQEGTPLNKDSLLKDTTAALFGLGADAVPDDVLASIKPMIDSNYSELSSLANSKAKIAIGSYVGTGRNDERYPNMLTFDFIPKYIAIYYIGSDYDASPIKTELMQGMYGVFHENSIFCVTYYDGDNANVGVILEWGTTVKFYADYNHQPNKQGATYKYFAIG